MTKEELRTRLEEDQLEDLIELLDDAEAGDLEELEVVKSIGLLYDKQLSDQMLNILEQLNVKIIYVTDED